MARTKLSIEPAAIGLALANAVAIWAVIACCFFARRAWQLRDDALTALAETRASAARREAIDGGVISTNHVEASATGPRAEEPTIHPAGRRLRRKRMDRLLLLGVLGVGGSAFFAWLLVSRSRSLTAARFAAGPARARPPGRVRARSS